MAEGFGSKTMVQRYSNSSLQLLCILQVSRYIRSTEWVRILGKIIWYFCASAYDAKFLCTLSIQYCLYQSLFAWTIMVYCFVSSNLSTILSSKGINAVIYTLPFWKTRLFDGKQAFCLVFLPSMVSIWNECSKVCSTHSDRSWEPISNSLL